MGYFTVLLTVSKEKIESLQIELLVACLEHFLDISAQDKC